MYLIGYDVGSSSIKGCLFNIKTNKAVASAQYPKTEMVIQAPQIGWAEQDPDQWWNALVKVSEELSQHAPDGLKQVKAIGISYQMHGLVLVDKDMNLLRPSIIWCDSRAVNIGKEAFDRLGHENCLANVLNSPGNFTASKLAWVKKNEPQIFDRVYKMMLPGDYIAMRMSGNIQTTISGLSEGIFYDFKNDELSSQILNVYDLDQSLIPDIVPTFGVQAQLSDEGARALGLLPGIPITYRAGDQPNNALSLNVLKPGEVAATAGTSGVVYGISDVLRPDPLSRVNSFAHVNHSDQKRRIGILLCINGTGIMYSWAHKNLRVRSYDEMNEHAERIDVGSEGLTVFPFGNGAERMLENANPGALISGLHFNVHDRSHMIRGIKEGIAAAFYYGIEIMQDLGMKPRLIKAGHANMFQSAVFREAIANLSGAEIELFNTDGAQGAARGAGIGLGVYDVSSAFKGLHLRERIEPDTSLMQQYADFYGRWKEGLQIMLNQG